MGELLSDEIPLKDRLLRNGFWMYFLSFIIAPAGYLVKLMVSRELSVEDIGLIYSIIGFIGLLSSFNDFGLTEALQYYLPQYIIDKEYNKAKSILIITRIVQFLGGIVIGGVLYFIAPRMANHYFHSPQAIEILRYFCFYFLFINLFQVLQSVFIALQNVKYQYISDAIRMRLVVGCVSYVYFSSSIDIYVFAKIRLFSIIIGVVIAGYLLNREYHDTLLKASFSWDKKLLASQWSYARKIMIGMQVGAIYTNIGQQFSIAFLGPYEAGIRTNYMMFFTGISIIIGPIISYLFPLFTELYKKNEQTKILLMKKYLIRGTLIVSLLIAIGGWFLSERVAVAFLTEKFRMSGILFKWTSLGMFFVIGSWINFTLLAGSGYVEMRVRLFIYGTILSLFLSYIGILKFGIYGLMISIIITHIYFLIHSSIIIKRLGI